MNLSKYVEIHCKNLFLQNNNEPPAIIAKSRFPLLHSPDNISESCLYNLQRSNKKWHPIMDDILFSNYVGEFLQVTLYFLQVPEGTLVTANTSFEKMKVLGKSILTFSRSLTLPLFDYKQVYIYKNNLRVGYVNLDIYIRPVIMRRSFFYKPVTLFPFSENEIAVYYNGFLKNSQQVYCMFTTDEWNSHVLKKMLRCGNNWMIMVDKVHKTEQIELAFTNEKEVWDNQDNRNWLFRETVWC
ncbi:hypothetical protein [Candidatus Uabimicrobium amorphum]|uniref:Carbohydrate binding module family 25 domain-containing protein n=1 Tax=Uabimicrobium amorphum TaxID=2596890 RepID=A0A5S9F411_UABAM|nr:hypothetical protein [Candidatus Uabimicrobium amorphum]BBM85266.1 hypothetical protein UABAM_03629 [Candidatus Uabimicrobium amorphum]